MTEDSARTITNVVLVAAALGAAFVILRNPPMRRLAWRLAVVGLTGKLPQWVAHEVHQAWAETAPGADAVEQVRTL